MLQHVITGIHGQSAYLESSKPGNDPSLKKAKRKKKKVDGAWWTTPTIVNLQPHTWSIMYNHVHMHTHAYIFLHTNMQRNNILIDMMSIIFKNIWV